MWAPRALPNIASHLVLRPPPPPGPPPESLTGRQRHRPGHGCLQAKRFGSSGGGQPGHARCAPWGSARMAGGGGFAVEGGVVGSSNVRAAGGLHTRAYVCRKALSTAPPPPCPSVWLNGRPVRPGTTQRMWQGSLQPGGARGGLAGSACLLACATWQRGTVAVYYSLPWWLNGAARAAQPLASLVPP